MIQFQDLSEYAPCFGAPRALPQQNQQLEARFLVGATPPDDAEKVLDRFWGVGRAGENLTRDELNKLTWCFGRERNGRRILDDLDATLALLTLAEQRYRRSYLYGLRYTFFYAYNPGSAPFELFRSALRQILSRLDFSDPSNLQWRELFALVKSGSHAAIARRVVAEDIPYGAIAERFSTPSDALFYSYVCRALVDALIALRRVQDKEKSLLDFLTECDDFRAIQYTVARLLTHHQDIAPAHVNRRLTSFALKHLGDPRVGNALYWRGVSKDGLNLFVRWLSAVDLELFFDLAASDRGRKAFWMDYLGSIEYSRLVLGESGKRRFTGLLDEGCHAELVDGRADENALILKLGGVVIVELSGAQNRRYVYEDRAVPFGLNAQTYQISELRHPNALLQHDLNGGRQGENLADLLHMHFGVYRNQARRHAPLHQPPPTFRHMMTA